MAGVVQIQCRDSAGQLIIAELEKALVSYSDPQRQNIQDVIPFLPEALVSQEAVTNLRKFLIGSRDRSTGKTPQGKWPNDFFTPIREKVNGKQLITEMIQVANRLVLHEAHILMLEHQLGKAIRTLPPGAP